MSDVATDGLLEIHRSLFPERYDDETEMLLWNGDTLPGVVEAIERIARATGDERFKLEVPEKFLHPPCFDGTRRHHWSPSRIRPGVVVCQRCGIDA